MLDIIKSLKTSELTTVIIVLGLVREIRLFIKMYLDYKIKTRK